MCEGFVSPPTELTNLMKSLLCINKGKKKFLLWLDMYKSEAESCGGTRLTHCRQSRFVSEAKGNDYFILDCYSGLNHWMGPFLWNLGWCWGVISDPLNYCPLEARTRRCASAVTMAVISCAVLWLDVLMKHFVLPHCVLTCLSDARLPIRCRIQDPVSFQTGALPHQLGGII